MGTSLYLREHHFPMAAYPKLATATFSIESLGRANLAVNAMRTNHRPNKSRAQRPAFSLAAHGGLSLRSARFLSLCRVDQIGLARLSRLPPPVRQVVELLQRLVLQNADDYGLFLGRQPLIQRRPRATLRRKAGSTAIRFRPATER